MTTVSPAPRRVATRTEQLAVAHIQAHRLGLETRIGKDRTEYENILMAVSGVRSLRRASRDQREAAIRFFDDCLAQQDARSQHAPAYVSDAEALEVLGL